VFTLLWTVEARRQYQRLRDAAEKAAAKRRRKTPRQVGLFKQVNKTLRFLRADPRHPSLQTHEFRSLENPYDSSAKVFEAYVQQKTPSAYRVFWCYGPKRTQITVLSITPHP
jgi:hypothetical protein